jgi:hypothetical protein
LFIWLAVTFNHPSGISIAVVTSFSRPTSLTANAPKLRLKVINPAELDGTEQQAGPQCEIVDISAYYSQHLILRLV